MIETLTIESFKSIQSVTLELGQVNVFIGANGSGKSNLLEALAVLSAAASGKVDQSTLVYRGCRASTYYRPMFEGCSEEAETHLVAKGSLSVSVDYDVTLKAPPVGRLLPWEFQAERWERDGMELLDRKPDAKGQHNDPQAGLAALRLAEMAPVDPASIFLKSLAAYSIYSPDTPVLHGWVKDTQEREPVGLGGGRLAEGLQDLVKHKGAWQTLHEEFEACVDWFGAFGVFALSEDGKASSRNIAFVDRFFNQKEGHFPFLSPNDVNEGALYLTFLAVLGLHPLAPRLFAIENVDHGLNPLLAKRLMSTLTERILSAEAKRQVFLTTHNPLVLDGLPLGDDRVRLFTVDRDNKGHTVVKRFIVTDKHREMAEKGWTLSRMWINKLIGGVPDV
jgi:predicted ATPase